MRFLHLFECVSFQLSLVSRTRIPRPVRVPKIGFWPKGSPEIRFSTRHNKKPVYYDIGRYRVYFRQGVAMMGSLLSGGLALALSASIGKFLLKRFLGGFEAAAGDARAIPRLVVTPIYTP